MTRRARLARASLFVAPFLLLYVLILIFPLLRGMWLSFHRADLFGARPLRRLRQLRRAWPPTRSSTSR